MYLKKLKDFLLSILPTSKKSSPKISLLVPFDGVNEQRVKVVKWLKKYWKHELPDAEFILTTSDYVPFCKTNALNKAARKAKGKVLVILDADAFISGKVINRCADRILEDLDNHLWYIPYRRLYRLTKNTTEYILASSPTAPYIPPSPPPREMIENHGHASKYGHRYGAMCMVFPREALDTLGCFDERFKGWGGEDIALLRALDTLWGKHKTVDNDILHMWHPYIGKDYTSRMWENQQAANLNSTLASTYHKASKSPAKMREIVDEGCKSCKNK